MAVLLYRAVLEYLLLELENSENSHRILVNACGKVALDVDTAKICQ